MDTNQITPFEFHGNDVRALTDEHGDPWFIAKDICDVLGTDTKDLRAILDADEIANLDTIEVHHTAGRAPLIVSEAGFYKLVLRSRKPVAKEFQRWSPTRCSRRSAAPAATSQSTTRTTRS